MRAGLSPRMMRARMAAMTGEKPMAVTVPTATPACWTPQKKNTWKPSRPSVAGMSQRSCQCRRPAGREWRQAHQAQRASAPICMRRAPMPRGWLPSGARACTVPVVLKHRAPRMMHKGPPASREEPQESRPRLAVMLMVRQLHR